MEYSFKKFTGKGKRQGGSWISYNKSGFLFSSGFISQTKIPNYVVLYYDAENQAVGFLFTDDPNTDGVLKVIKSNKGTTASISSRAFVNTHNLEKPELYGRKNPEKVQYEDVGQLFVIKLKSPEIQKTAPSGNATLEEVLPQ